LLSVTRPWGRAIAQAGGRRLPTAASRVPSQVRSCGICGGQNGTGADVLRVLRFLLPVLILPTAPHSSSGDDTVGQTKPMLSWSCVTTAWHFFGLCMEETDNWKRVVLQLGGLGLGLRAPPRKKTICYEILHRASDLDGFFG
jgi:hypothetical protein